MARGRLAGLGSPVAGGNMMSMGARLAGDMFLLVEDKVAGHSTELLHSSQSTWPARGHPSGRPALLIASR